MEMQIFTEKEEIEFLWDWPDQNDYRVIFSIFGWRLKMGVSFGHFLVSVMSRMPNAVDRPTIYRLKSSKVAAFIELEPFPIFSCENKN